VFTLVSSVVVVAESVVSLRSSTSTFVSRDVTLTTLTSLSSLVMRTQSLSARNICSSWRMNLYVVVTVSVVVVVVAVVVVVVAVVVDIVVVFVVVVFVVVAVVVIADLDPSNYIRHL